MVEHLGISKGNGGGGGGRGFNDNASCGQGPVWTFSANYHSIELIQS